MDSTKTDSVTFQHAEALTETKTSESYLSVPDKIGIHAKTIFAVLAIDFIVFGQLMAVLGSGILAQQTTGLFGDTTKAVWLSTILTIFIVALNPPLSQAADLWGRKWILVITSLGGFVGPLIISRAQSIRTLIVGFCVLGLSFGSQSLLYAVPSEVIERRHRAWAQASVNCSASIAAVVAVLLGGGLTKSGNLENYRIFWYVVAAIYFLAVVSVIIGYNPPPRDLEISLKTREKIQKVDWIGALLITSGLTLLCIALQWSGTRYSWGDAHILATFIVGVILMSGFGIHELWFKADGVCHHALFNDRDFAITMVATFCEGIGFFTPNNYFVFEITVLDGIDSFSASLRFLIVFIVSMTSALVSGYWITKARQVREPLALGFAGLVVFNALMAGVNSSTPSAAYWGYAVFAGTGLGFILVSLTLSVQMSTPGALISPASGLFIATRGFGGAVGIAINNAIFQNGLKSLPTKVAEAVLPLGFPATELGLLIGALNSGNTTAIATIPGITPQILGAASGGLKEGYIHAFRYTWVAAACFSVVGLVTCLFLTNHKDQFTAHIDAPVEASLVDLQEKIEPRRTASKTRQGRQVLQDISEAV
ncbi:MFS general substrate transporter [Cadophora sp. DSE1049]|nr:MFS general substrate transporter [Cadophora sp. DSE1049]